MHPKCCGDQGLRQPRNGLLPHHKCHQGWPAVPAFRRSASYERTSVRYGSTGGCPFNVVPHPGEPLANLKGVRRRPRVQRWALARCRSGRVALRRGATVCVPSYKVLYEPCRVWPWRNPVRGDGSATQPGPIRDSHERPIVTFPSASSATAGVPVASTHPCHPGLRSSKILQLGPCPMAPGDVPARRHDLASTKLPGTEAASSLQVSPDLGINWPGTAGHCRDVAPSRSADLTRFLSRAAAAGA